MEKVSESLVGLCGVFSEPDSTVLKRFVKRKTALGIPAPGRKTAENLL